MDRPKFFFSYARRDSEFVLRLAQDLRAEGVELWLDQLDIRGGQRWDRAIEEALQICPGMLVVLTPESLASNSVMDEVSYALEEQKLVVPILLRPCDIPFRLRRVQHVDFTTSYEQGFTSLLKALQIEAPVPQISEMSRPVAEIEAPAVLPSPPHAEPLPLAGLTARPAPLPASPDRPGRLWRRLPRWARGALLGASLGAISEVLVLLSVPVHDFSVIADFVAFVGVFWAITGALAWQIRRAMLSALIGLLMGTAFGGLVFRTEAGPLQAALSSFGPLGVFVGALIGRFIERWAKKRLAKVPRTYRD